MQGVFLLLIISKMQPTNSSWFKVFSSWFFNSFKLKSCKLKPGKALAIIRTTPITTLKLMGTLAKVYRLKHSTSRRAGTQTSAFSPMLKINRQLELLSTLWESISSMMFHIKTKDAITAYIPKNMYFFQTKENWINLFYFETMLWYLPSQVLLLFSKDNHI